ncbi:MAG: CBS domain-containing protein [Actinomycetota bacterium]|nr:CBS domain-containing protein [Actinomycetota bacterium]
MSRTTLIGSVMRTSVASIQPEVTLRRAAAELARAEVGTLAIMDDDAVVGMVSERDIVRALATGADPDEALVASVMSRQPRYLTLGDDVASAVDIMAAAGIRHLPVVDDGELVGIVSIRDLAKAGGG